MVLSRPAIGAVVIALAAVAALAAAGCAGSSSVRCGDDRLCPAGTLCVAIAIEPAEQLCATRDEVDRCTGLPDYARCGEGLRCYSGVCLPGGCGNRRVDRADPRDPSDIAEQCDDGNQTPGDGCSADCRSDERCRNGQLDVATEQCDDRNPVSHDGCSSTCELEAVRWVPVVDADLLRASYAATYDARRERVLVFGGRTDLLVSTLRGDTLEWDGVHWRALAGELSPSPRAESALIYDAVRDRSVLFGGVAEGGTLGDTWEWDGARWSAIDPPGPPPKRHGHAMAYDPIHRRAVVFGGVGAGGTLGDTWAWDGVQWTALLDVMPPAPRSGHAMAFDARRGVIVLFGGRDASGELADTWVLDGDDWSPAGGAGPGPRHDHAMTTDPATGAVVLAGGRDDSNAVLTDTWRFDGSWTLLDPSGPELADHRLAVFPPHRSVVAITSGVTFEWSGTGWASAGSTSSQRPEPRVDHAAVLDPLHRRVVMFGGRTAAGAVADTWTWDGHWVHAATAQKTPPPRFDAAIAYDAARDEVVLFGGTDPDQAELGDTWVFDGTEWTERVVAGPRGRHGHVMAYDPARAQVVLFGGDGFADTWAWNGTAWAEQKVAGPPPTRGAALAYDPPRRELVLFGGVSGSGPSAETWTWNGAAWSKRTPVHLPPARGDAAMAYDAARRRLVMVGGAEVATLDDVWEWDGSEWTQLAIASGLTTRRGHTLVPSPEGDSLFVFGGEHRTPVGDQLLDDLVALRHGAAPAADRCARRDTDGDALAGCADPDCWQRCSPLCPHGVDPASFECTTGPRCGDGTCSPIESCGSCPGDCGACPEVCGDSVCSPGETCPGDCAR